MFSVYAPGENVRDRVVMFESDVTIGKILRWIKTLLKY